MSTTAGWLLYDDQDYEMNRSFAELMVNQAQSQGFSLAPVLLSQITLQMEKNRPSCLLDGQEAMPEFIISRQRDSFVSAHLEQMGIPVFNNAKVCALCNDKRRTHQFLQGIPMLQSEFPSLRQRAPSSETTFPVIVKPACSHGGDRVFWVNSEEEWIAASAKILPQPMLQQEIASDYGQDLRVYVLFGQIVAGVMRRAKQGFISNFKLGGDASLHILSEKERALAQEIIQRFQAAGAPLSFAGIDFLYHQGEPVFSEVEDVVGSRMLYQVSDINIGSLFWKAFSRRFSVKQ